MDQDRTAAEAIAAFMISVAEMGETEAESKRRAAAYSRSLVGRSDPVVLRAAAEAVSHFPTPMEVSVERFDDFDKFAAMLGVTSTEHQLLAAINARSWLLQMADDIQLGRPEN